MSNGQLAIQSRRIVPAAAPGMAAADAAEALPRAPHGAVLLDRFDEVLAARRLEAAARADEGADAELIAAHRGDQRPAGYGDHSLPKRVHIDLLAKLAGQAFGKGAERLLDSRHRRRGAGARQGDQVEPRR